MALESVIDSNNRLPGLYLRTSLGVGTRSRAADPRTVILYGNKLASAPMAVETEVDVFGEDDAADKAGQGSELHHMARVAFGAYPNARVKMVAVTESGGTAASGTITFTGTATRNNTVRTRIQGILVETSVAVGDDPTAVAAAHAADINDNPDLPVTAAAVAGVITLTHRHAGPRGNHCRLISEMVDGAGTTAVAVSGPYLTGGATSDDPQNAIDATVTRHNTYLAIPYDNVDQAQIAKFVTHIDAEDEPEVGNRKRGICAELAALATADDTPAANNDPRLQVLWMENSEWTPAMLSAAWAAVRARREEDPAYNFNDEEIPGLPGHTPGDAPERLELITAINNGLTPIVTSPDGTARVAKSITSKFQDSGGNPDYRVHDTHKVAIVDRFADDLEVRVADTHGKTSAAAEADFPEDEGVPAGVTTEELLKDTIVALQREYRGQGRLQKVEELVASTIVDPPTTGGRFNAAIPLDPVELFHQLAGDLRQVG